MIEIAFELVHTMGRAEEVRTLNYHVIMQANFNGIILVAIIIIIFLLLPAYIEIPH